MSYSRTLTGTASAILAGLASLPDEVRESDRTLAPEVIALHEAQVEKGIDTVKRFVGSAPEGYTFNAMIFGHGGIDAERKTSSDSWGVHISANRPADLVGESVAMTTAEPEEVTT